MVDRAGTELEYRAHEWTHGIVVDWLAVNETARACQRGMPADDQEHLAQLPKGFGSLGATMAGSVSPETLIIANAVLTSAEEQLRSLLESGSLSHPIARFGTKTDAEVTVSEGPDRVAELEQQLREARAERDDYAQALRMLAAGAEAALSPPTLRGACSSADAAPGR